ncbi:MAG: D-alanine--D-alanine ligase [Flavobacteriales bacterium]
MKRIGLFCGGFSSEFDISIKSAQTIRTHFPSNAECVLIIVKKNSWEVQTAHGNIPFDLNTATYALNGVEQKLDAGLVYTHGDPGENGKIQAYLDMIGIPCINSGVLASALSFDKWYCNQFLKGFGFRVASSVIMTNPQQFGIVELVDQLGLPIFVKPADSGSSYGISKVKAVHELAPALEIAFREGKRVVLEAFLDGTEVTCGVYRSKEGVVALPLTEIVSDTEFFDYEAKYNGKSQEITPARISPESTEKVQETAKRIYDLLGLKAIARIDFMLVNETPYIIEVNTTPGFSPASIVPQMLGAAQKRISDFWQEIIEVELS